MALILISSERFAEHQTPPGHPECPERAEVMDVVASEWRRQGGEVVAPRSATDEQLARVHDAAYLSALPEPPAARWRSTRTRTRRRKPTRSRCLPRARRSMRSSGCMARPSPAGPRARSAARPSRRTRSRDGLLLLQQRRRGGRPRAGAWARLASRSSTTTCIMATARSTSSRADPDVLYVSIHQFPLLPGHRRGRRSRRGTGRVSRSTFRSRWEPSTRTISWCSRTSCAGPAAVQARSGARVGGVRRARARSARRHAADHRRRSRR